MEERYMYRAWLKDYKKMVEVTGLYANSLIEALLSEEDMDYSEFNPSEYTLMQCTGLKDKNGVLIFEGDIIHDSKYNLTGQMYWNNSLFLYAIRWNDGRHNKLMDIPSFENIEVIGNIHENPELLEVSHV